MRVFVTGATGFVGSAIVKELTGAGHLVLGLARNETASNALQREGVEVHRGDLSDPESLKAGAERCDGVIHCAYNHDFSQFAAAGEMDRRAVEAIGNALAGTGHPFVITSAIGVLPPGKPTNESDVADPHALGATRMPSEETALALSLDHVRSCVIRLAPAVHDLTRQGFATIMIALARQTGVSAYVDGGLNHWPAVHRLDAARLFRLALEKCKPGSRFHAIGEDAVSLRAIAEAIGKLLNVPVVSKTPEEAASHFGFLAHFVSSDFQVSSTRTKETLGWNPTGPSLIADIERAVKTIS